MAYDSNWALVPLLMRFNGNEGSQTIVNEVTGMPVTAAGNASLSQTQKKFGNASVYFDGSQDWLELPYSSLYDPGSTDFTVEMWTYCTQYNPSNTSILCGTYSYGSVEGGTGNAGWMLGALASTGYLATGWGGGGSWTTIINTTTPLPLNVWSHVALCKVGDQFTIYLNGTSIGTASYSTPVTITKTKFKLGGAMGGDGNHYYFYFGYIDEFRLTKGVSRYTGNFTPPTEKFPYPIPDSEWSKDVLLMHFDGANNSTVFVDEVSRKKITVYGDAKISTSQSKFGGSSGYFDGTGDYLSIPNSTDLLLGTGDFTIECWWYPLSSSPSNVSGMSKVTTSSGTGWAWGIYNGTWRFSTYNTVIFYTGAVVLNSWTHVAITRLSGVMFWFINGINIASNSNAFNFSDTANLLIGTIQGANDFDGYLDELRITKGIARYTGDFTPPNKEFYYPHDPYWETVSLQLNFDGANNSTAFIEDTGKAINRYGDAKISTTQSKFGGASAYFDGSGDYLTVGSSVVLFAGDFTIECWIYFIATSNSGYYSIMDSRGVGGYNNNTAGFLNVGGIYRPDMVFSNGRFTGTTTQLALNTWMHIAFVRSGSTVSAFVNGVKDATTYTYSGTITPGGSNLWIGAVVEPIYTQGYIDSLRITNGLARYTADFVVPDSAFLLPPPINLLNPSIGEKLSIGSTNTTNILTDDDNYYQELIPYYNDSGIWSISGIVTIKSVPVQATVYLFTKADKRLIKSTLSNSQGEYTFSGLKNQSYFVWAEDPTETYNPITRLTLNEVI